MSVLVIVAGPNGSGKTTLTARLLARARIKSTVINPDDIALKDFGGYKYRIEAAKSALNKRTEAINNNFDFAFETTFSGNSEINDLKKARRSGYRTILYFVALQSILDNIVRVEERKNNMGHNVELEDLIRRSEKSKSNLIKYLTSFDILSIR